MAEETLHEEAARRAKELEEEGVDPTSVPLPTITGRSDFDEHSDDYSALGEDLGDGVYAAEEPVKMYRDARGNLIRTVPLSEVAEEEARMREDGLLGEDPPPMVGAPSMSPVPMQRHEREDVVDAMALKLYLWYQEQPPGLMYNPIYDGIPHNTSGSDPKALHMRQGDSALKPASTIEILEWFKRIIGARAEIVNEQTIGAAWKQDVLRIHREPLAGRGQ
jgi:hypothetical protein